MMPSKKYFPEIEITFAPVWWQQKYGMDFGSSKNWQDPIISTEREREQRRLLFERFGDVGLGEVDPKPHPVVGGEFGHRFMSAFWGCEIAYLVDQWPHATPLHDSWARMHELMLPDVKTSTPVQLLFRNARILEAHYGSCKAVINYGGPLNNAVSVLGEEIFILCAENADWAKEVLMRMAEAVVNVHDQVECVINRLEPAFAQNRSWEIGNCPVSQISPTMYRNVVLPIDQWLAAKFSGEFWLHHCGFFHPYAEVYRHLKPQALDVGPGTDLRLTRIAYPEARISAYIDPSVLGQMSKSQIDAHVEKLVIDAGLDGLFTWLRVAEIGPEISDETVRDLMTVFERLQIHP